MANGKVTERSLCSENMKVTDLASGKGEDREELVQKYFINSQRAIN